MHHLDLRGLVLQLFDERTIRLIRCRQRWRAWRRSRRLDNGNLNDWHLNDWRLHHRRDRYRHALAFTATSQEREGQHGGCKRASHPGKRAWFADAFEVTRRDGVRLA